VVYWLDEERVKEVLAGNAAINLKLYLGLDFTHNNDFGLLHLHHTINLRHRLILCNQLTAKSGIYRNRETAAKTPTSLERIWPGLGKQSQYWSDVFSKPHVIYFVGLVEHTISWLMPMLAEVLLSTNYGSWRRRAYTESHALW
jgi:hypothetical protein